MPEDTPIVPGELIEKTAPEDRETNDSDLSLNEIVTVGARHAITIDVRDGVAGIRHARKGR